MTNTDTTTAALVKLRGCLVEAEGRLKAALEDLPDAPSGACRHAWAEHCDRLEADVRFLRTLLA